MPIRAKFLGGPLDGGWRALQEPIQYIKIVRPVKETELEVSDETAYITPPKGTYKRIGFGGLIMGEATYQWQGWDDDLPEMQEEERR